MAGDGILASCSFGGDFAAGGRGSGGSKSPFSDPAERLRWCVGFRSPAAGGGVIGPRGEARGLSPVKDTGAVGPKWETRGETRGLSAARGGVMEGARDMRGVMGSTPSSPSPYSGAPPATHGGCILTTAPTARSCNSPACGVLLLRKINLKCRGVLFSLRSPNSPLMDSLVWHRACNNCSRLKSLRLHIWGPL